MRVPPFHTTNAEYPPSHREVHHDQSECHYGKSIKVQDRADGTGGKPLCKECQRLA